MSGAARLLCQMVADVLDQEGLSQQAEILQRALGGAVDGHLAAPREGRSSLPLEVADRYYEGALAAARADHESGLADGLASCAHLLSWTQTDTYVTSPPHEHFLERYAHATILGSDPATALLVEESRAAAVGVLLLGSDNQYPHHQHYADEVYVPLTGASWSSGASEPYVVRRPGTVLHHASLQPHSVHTGERSLLALYLWTGHTAASAWLC